MVSCCSRPFRTAAKRSPGPKPVRLGEGGVHHHLVRARRVRHPTGAQDRQVQRRLAFRRQRQDARGCRFGEPRKVKHGIAGHSGLDGLHAGNARQLGREQQWRPRRRGEDVCEAVALVVGRPGLEERHLRPEGQHKDRHPGGQHQRDCEALRPESAEIAQKLHIEWGHSATKRSPPARGGRRFPRSGRCGRRRSR